MRAQKMSSCIDGEAEHARRAMARYTPDMMRASNTLDGGTVVGPSSHAHACHAVLTSLFTLFDADICR